MAKIALVAADFGESKCLASISRELRQRRHETIEWFGYGNGLVPHPGLVESVTTNIDWLLLALSENNQEEAVLAQKAAAEKIPIAVYAPGKNTYRLRSAAPLRPLTNLLFGHAEELDATAILFVNAKVVPAGNILHEDFYSPYSRETARAKLKMSDGQNLIFVPGDKRRGINWPLFHSVIEAAHRPEVQTHKPMVAIGLHPGDPDPKESYGELARFSRQVPMVIQARETMPSMEIVAACDLMVTAVSTLAVAAIYQRRPVIGFFFENLLADIEGASGGRFTWEPKEFGVAKVVRGGSIDQLATEMDSIFSGQGFEEMVRLQKASYPKSPVPGTTAKLIADQIELIIFSALFCQV